MGHFRDDAEVVGDEEDGQAEIGLQFQQQVDDLRLEADVQRGGRFVGDEQGGPAGDGLGDGDALAQAAAELVRIFAGALARFGDADFVHGLDGPLPGRAAAELLVQPQSLGDLFADGVDRVERGQRVLEDHRRVLAADGAHFALREARQLAAAQGDGIGLDRRFRRRQAQQGQGDAGLAAAALADHGQGAALVQRERGVVHGVERLAAQAKRTDRFWTLRSGIYHHSTG